MTFRVRTAVMALAAALLLAGTTGASASASVPASAAAADATARAAANCRPPRYPGSGYFTSLRVTRVGCSTGSSVATSHYRCRVRGGAEGRCRSRVRGYRCSERRRSVSTEFNAVVTCRRGDRRVVFSYQQNT
jgi:hypothetical protein